MIRICALTCALRDIFSLMRRVPLVFLLVTLVNIVVVVEVLHLESAWNAPMVLLMLCISVLENHTIIIVAAGSAKKVIFRQKLNQQESA